MQDFTTTSPTDQPPPPRDAATPPLSLRADPVFVAFTTLARRIVATYDGAERVGYLDALDKALECGTAVGQMRRIAALARTVSDVV